jgi:hypothetical protein
MESPELLTVSLIGYIIAFGVLALLALTMRLITTAFPGPKPEPADDAAVVAAISAAYKSAAPGATVTKIEETT